ncbi:porin [Veronia pacifica]|uniref:Porin domain-containing protein n=1 Tax=Veronia pacifica TaxID=1080227 RepID=A0A1C3ES45_9GAMM|nr:porin [Veronia pacifica]ODA36041.1 hypothetical protein A8L45_00050 [Veronia pacifica]
MNKKLLAVAIPAALFAGSASAYEVVTSEKTTVALSGKVGAEYKVVDSYEENATESTRKETNSVTEGTGTLKVEVKHALNDTTDALGGISFDLESGDSLAAGGRYIGVSLVGGEHVLKYGEVDLVEGVGPVAIDYDELNDGENVIRYTFSNDTVTVDTSFDDASTVETTKQKLKAGTTELEDVVTKTDKARVVAVSATFDVSNFEVSVGHNEAKNADTTKHQKGTGLTVKTDVAGFTVDAGYASLTTSEDKKDDVTKTGLKGGVEYVLDALTLSGSYKVVDTDSSDVDEKTTELGAEYKLDKWTYNADLTLVDNGNADKQTAKLAAKYEFTDSFNVSASYESVNADVATDDETTYLVGAELTW